MKDKAMWVVRELQSYARQYERGDSFGWMIEATPKIMYMAADLIEKLSADLESDERKYGRDAFETILAEGLKTEAERDAWKRRAEAAERDIKHLLACGGLPACHYCKCNPNSLFDKPLDVCKCAQEAEWRGPCAENGGVDDGGHQAD